MSGGWALVGLVVLGVACASMVALAFWIAAHAFQGSGAGDASTAGSMAPAPENTALDRLRTWADDDLHLGQSVRFHQPTYANPAEIRRDVGALIEVVEAAREVAARNLKYDDLEPLVDVEAAIAARARLEEALSKFERGV